MNYYDKLMQKNLIDVFGERDPARRFAAIQALYAEDAILFEPHAAAKGHAEISEAVTTLLHSIPSTFLFTAVGPAVGHHGVARLQWRSGPKNGPVAVTGTDVAHIENDLIKTLHVFLDP